jgi:hypothetical protein
LPAPAIVERQDLAAQVAAREEDERIAASSAEGLIAIAASAALVASISSGTSAHGAGG